MEPKLMGGFVLAKLRERRIWERVIRERLSEPLHLNLASTFIAGFGSFRAKVYWDLVVRQSHAFGLLWAADQAARQGHSRVTAIEFGVANGAGLLNMCSIGARVTKTTGVIVDLVGFDAGTGMPPPRDYRDHPEKYRQFDYPMEDPRRLQEALPRTASLVLGDIAETVPRFLEQHHHESPIGYVVLDVDYYWSSAEAMRVFTGAPLHYLPATAIYCDDVQNPEHNQWQGELLAIDEFNRANPQRKISRFNFLREDRLFKNASWISHMFMLHVLDHPIRTTIQVGAQQPARLTNPYLRL